LKLDFTAGATPVTVTNLVLTRTGLSQDSDLDNVYLYSGATKLASNLGFNNGAITFSNGAGLFTVPANSTQVVTVTVDIDKGGQTGSQTASDSGHIFQIGLASAANVTGGTFTGNFPLNSAQFTIASVNNLATLTVSGNSSSTINANAGQTDVLVGQFNVQAGNNPVKVTSFNFTNVGSVQPNYLQNVKLMDGSVQLGATITSLASNNIATFDLSGAPLMLTSGQSATLSIYADLMGGVGRNFQFSIQQSSDVNAVDTTYGVGIGAITGTGAQANQFPIEYYNVNIQQGNLVISKDLSSPTTYAVAGNTNQVLGIFDVLASGDSVKFSQLNFAVTGSNTSTVNNFRVVDDQGAQIGSTQNVITSSTTSGYVAANGTNGWNGGGALYTAGTGSLNYIVPGNTTRVLTVYGDLPSTASGTIQVSIVGGTAQSYTTYVPANVTAVGANSLNILASGSNLVVSANYGLGTPSASAGASNVEIGSYTLTAGQINPVNLTGITINTTGTYNPQLPYAAYLTNLHIVQDGTTNQLGTTYSQVLSGSSYSFNGTTPIVIPANGSVTLDVFANISSNVTATSTVAQATSLASVNASTQAGNAVSVVAAPGQNIAFNTGGTLTGSLSAGTSQASYLGMNVPGVNVAQYQFVADNYGSETLTQVNIFDSATTTGNVAASASDIINYRLTNSSGVSLSTATENNGVLSFNLTGLVIPSNSTQYLNLVADTNSYPNAISGHTHAYALTTFQYTNASHSTTTPAVVGNSMGNLFTVYQTTLGVTGPSFSSPSSISGVGNIVGEFTFTAGSGNINPIVKTVTLSTGGSLVVSSTHQTLGLFDSSAPSVLLASATTTGNGTTTFNLAGINSNQWTIPYSSSKTLLVETYGTPSGFASGANNGYSYQVLLNGVTWSDGTSQTNTSSTYITSLSPSISIPVPSQNITNLSN
jgi:hypothetical protein